MAANLLEIEMTRWLNTLDRETTNLLNIVKDDIIRAGLGHEFKINCLKSANYRLMETFKRFETILLMERTLKITTTESTEQPRLQQHVVDQQGGNDIQMTEVKSVQQSCEGRWHQNNINSTPSALREGSMNGYDKMFEKRCSNTDSNMSSKAVPNSKKNDFVRTEVNPIQNVEWMCFYCKGARQGNLREFVFTKIRDLQDHWRAQHHMSDNQEPFQFYAIHLLSCKIGKCRYYSTFQGLHNHHRKLHHNENFIAIYENRCAICLYSGIDLNVHVCYQLETVQRMNIFNPILLTEETLSELTAVNKKFGCNYCNSFYDTKQDMLQHHRQSHECQMIDSGLMENKSVIAFICGCCQRKIAANSLVSHLKSRAQQQWSGTYNWEAWFLQFQAKYFRTKVVFANGLVMFKLNLMATVLGGYSGFMELARELFDSMQQS